MAEGDAVFPETGGMENHAALETQGAHATTSAGVMFRPDAAVVTAQEPNSDAQTVMSGTGEPSVAKGRPAPVTAPQTAQNAQNAPEPPSGTPTAPNTP